LRVAEYDQQLLTSKAIIRNICAELGHAQRRQPFHVTVTIWLQRGFERVEAEIQELRVCEDTTARLEHEAGKQRADLELKLAENKAALQQSTQQATELRDRVTQLQDELHAAQHQHAQQLARQRVEANSQHAQELRALKESYEQ